MTRLTFGVDIGGMSIKAGIVDGTGKLLCRAAVATEPESLSQEAIMARTADLLTSLMLQEGLEPSELDAIGMGAPGTSENETGRLIFAGNLPFRNTPMRRLLRQRFDLPVFLGNDANVAALAESRVGEGRGCDSSIVVTLGTGIGAGVVIQDRVYAGFNGAGCELGHMLLIKGGVPCTCGRRGCVEAYCAAPALMAQTKAASLAHPDSRLHQMIQAQGGQVDGRVVFDAREAGCPVAAAAVAQYMDYLADSLVNFINAYFPERLILGGGVSAQGEWFRQALEAMVLERCFDLGDLPQTSLALASLGNEAGMIGAAFFARDCLQDGLDGTRV